MSSITLSFLNNAVPDDFVRVLAGVFERSPWVAAAVVALRPFASREALHAAMVAAVTAASPNQQLALIGAHPDLGGKLAMSNESVSEQAGAGLDQLPPALFERFSSLNARYGERFGFPFIIAVRNHDRESILKAFERRLAQETSSEKDNALREIAEIARFRLFDLIESE
jgi:2-oxo-4-hydroxy-4-carboxy-5-ureidoimidazoline decarboxylase